VDRGVGEADLVADAEAGDAVKVQDGGVVGVGDRGERKHVGAGAGHEDAARAFAELERTGVLGGARGVADQAEETVVLERHGATGDAASHDVLSGVIKGELALVADEDAVGIGVADGQESSGAADDREAAVHAQLAGERVRRGEIERARAAIIDRAGRRSAAVDEGGGEVGHAGTLVDQDTVGRIVRKIDAAREGQGACAGDVVEEITISAAVLEHAADFDRVAADELGGFAPELDLVGDPVRAGKDDAFAAHGAALEFERPGAERAGLSQAKVALVEVDAARVGVGRTAAQLEDRAVRNRDAEAARTAGRRVGDEAVPDGLGALAADVEDAGVGVGLPVDVIAVDGEDGAVLETVGEGAIVAAGDLVDVGVDGDRRTPYETTRRVVIDDDRTIQGQSGGFGAENDAVTEQDATEDHFASRRDGTRSREGEGGRVGHRGDGIAEADARTVDISTDRKVVSVASREGDGRDVGDGGGGAAGVGTQAHRADRGESERATVVTYATGESIGAAEDPDAGVGLVDAKRLRGRGICQDGRDGVEVGIDAAQLEHAVVRRAEGGQRSGRAGVDDVRQGKGTGTAGLDTTAASGTGKVNRAGRDFARTDVGEGDGIVAARIPEFEITAAHIGTEGRGRGAGGADGRNDELLVAQDGIAGVGVGVAEDERASALLADVTRAGDHAGDGGVVETGETVVVDDDVAPAGAAESERPTAESQIDRPGSCRRRT